MKATPNVTKYTSAKLKKYNSGLSSNGPVSIGEIQIFEKNNNASVNIIYALNKNSSKKLEIYPLRICKIYHPENHWDFLNLTNDKTNHYYYITNSSALVNAQKKLQQKLYICRCCLQHFYSQEKLDEHVEYCYKFKPIKPVMPMKNVSDFLSFSKEKFKMCQMIDYVVYADFECVLSNYTHGPLSENQSSYYKHVHEPSPFCYYIVTRNSADKNDYQPVLYRGPNAVKNVWMMLQNDL